MMNPNAETQDLQNPWADRASLPSASLKLCVLAALACLLCALAIPLSFHATLTPIFAVLLFVCVVFFARTRASVTLTLVSALLVSFLLGLSGATVFLAVTVGTAVTAYLFTACARGWLFSILPFLAAGAAWFIVHDVWIALLAVAFLPAAGLLAAATLAGKKRTTAICFAIAGLLLSLLAILLVVIYRVQGDVDTEAIRASIDGLREWFIGEMRKLGDAMLKMAAEAVTDEQTQVAYDQLAKSLSEDALYATSVKLFDTVLGIVPALAAIICSVLAFEAQNLLNAIYYGHGFSKVLTSETTVFTMSITAAVIYVVAFLSMLFVSDSAMAGAVLQNIALILTPGFCLLGTQDIVQAVSRMRGSPRFILVVIIVGILCFSAGGGLLYFLAMWGAYGVLMRHIKEKLLDAMQNSSGEDHKD